MTARGSGRDLKVRVKTGKNRSLSSKLWLERQLNDPYVARAKREGFRSRAAYKLIEIDDKHHLFKPGAKVVDLGAAPGGWSQVAGKRVGAAEGRGRVVAIDLLDMAAMPGVEFLQLDFLDPRAPDQLKALLGGPADVVLSDMASNATGHRKTDHIRIMALAETAAAVRPRGAAAGRRLYLQGAARRHRGDAAGRAQTRLHERQARQARRQPGRFGGALSAGHRFPRQT